MKTKILNILYDHQNTYVSGEKMGSILAISRAAISKHIKQLKKEGYHIDSITNKGYCLHSDSDILYAPHIQKGLSSFYHTIEIVEEVDSTNDVLKHKQDIKEGYVLIANSQTKGKGRNGRSFHSPTQSGIYLSLYLTPSLSMHESLKITACVSVAITQAIQNIYGISPKIKWVNDLMMEDKKIAGILCEASLEMNTASLEYMVVGMGINVHTFSKPKEITQVAGSIEEFTCIKKDRNTLIREILNIFETYYTAMHENSFLKPYREHSYILQKDIRVIKKDATKDAKAIGIDENAYLHVAYEDGTTEILSSGEISIRKKENTTN